MAAGETRTMLIMARTIERTEDESRKRYTDKENWSAPEKSTNYYEGDQWDEAKQNSIEPAKGSRVRKRSDGQGIDGNRAKSVDRTNGANGRSVVGISPRKKSCGANAQGGGGFQPGNTCGKKNGSEAKPAERQQFKPANPDGKDTQERFKDKDGNYTPERSKLHAEIIKKTLSSKTPVENPIGYLMGGGPASRKFWGNDGQSNSDDN